VEATVFASTCVFGNDRRFLPDRRNPRGKPKYAKPRESNNRSLPLTDRGVPESAGPLLTLASGISLSLLRGQGAAIQSRQGIGRSGMVAVAVLLEATRLVSLARGVAAPETRGQTEWIRPLRGAFPRGFKSRPNRG